jgi:acyl-coenzyme A thioesterase PaaI-like protein
MDLPTVASKLDDSLGLTLVSAESGLATLRLEPREVGVVEDEDVSYLHGGALATCVDTAAW